jgi:hypothetical protein
MKDVLGWSKLDVEESVWINELDSNLDLAPFTIGDIPN